MSTTDADDPPAVNGRLRPRKNSMGAPAPTSAPPPGRARPARKPNDDKNKKQALKPPDKAYEPGKSLPYLRSLCPYCAGRFGSRTSVSKHIGRTHAAGGRPEAIQCQFCNHSEADADDIVRHMVDSHPNQYFACLQCHSRFLSTAELAVHKLQVCERQKPLYRAKKPPRPKPTDIAADDHYAGQHDFNGIVISCELKPSAERDAADIEDNITTNLILPPGKNSLVSTSMLEKNAVIVLDDIQWNKRIPPNFTFHNSDADQILSRLGVVHRSPRTSDHTRWYKHIEDTTKFERCFDTSFYSKVASNVQENLKKFLDGSFNRFHFEPEHVIKTRRAKNSVVINTAEGFPILLAQEQYSRNSFDSYMPRAIAPKHKWKWDNIESDRHPINPDQIKRDSHVNNCIITLVSSLDIWTQLCMRRKFEAKFNISSFNEKNTEKQNVIVNELKEILESREIPHREGSTSQVAKYAPGPSASGSGSTAEFPGSLGLMRAAASRSVPPAVLSGEWVRPRCYVCCACGDRSQDSKQLAAHIAARHPLAQVAHYEVVGEALLAADILKHLYVPQSRPGGNARARPRPPRGARECTKCRKGTTLEELHQHMLECAGDAPAVRRKVRSRPFGVRRRRPRPADPAPRDAQRVLLRSRQARRNARMRPRPRPRPPTRVRTEVGDAETIRRMIADLPAKRHRVSVTPTNPMLRPRRMREQPRNKLLMKRRVTDDLKAKKQRDDGDGGGGSPAPSSAATDGDDDAGPSRPRARLRRSHAAANTRISRISTKVMRQSEVFKRKTLMRNAKRKARANIEAASKENYDDVLMATSSFKTVSTDSLAADNTPNRIDVNKEEGNPRGHAARDGDGSHDGSKSGGSSNEQAQNGQNNRPAQITPLKHSIALLTAATETHDKSVQFQPHFLVQQECYKNLDRPYRPVEPQRCFENDIATVKIDKPPLFDFTQIGSAELQKNKANKPRKGLNDCIAMLKNKLVEPISPGASLGHRSVQCDTADMPQYAPPPLPNLPDYIAQSLSPPAPPAPRATRRAASVSPAVAPPPVPPAPLHRAHSATARQLTLSSPNTSMTTDGPPINPYLIPSSLSITPCNAAPQATTVTRSSRQKTQASPSTKPAAGATRSSARTSATAKSRNQRQLSVSRVNQSGNTPSSGRSRSTDAYVNPEVAAMKALPVQPMGPPFPVMPLATAKSPVSYTPWALSRSPLNITPPSPVRSPVNYPQLGPPISPVTFTSSPPMTREKSPGNHTQMSREKSPGYYSQKSPSYTHSTPSKSPVNYLPQAPNQSPVSFSIQPSGVYIHSDRDIAPGNYPHSALSHPPVLYMPQGFAQSPATYPPRAPERLPGNFPLHSPGKSPANYPSHFPAKTPVEYSSQVTAKSPVNSLVKPVAKSPVSNIPASRKNVTHFSQREPIAQLSMNFTQMDHAKTSAKSPVTRVSQPEAKSPVTFTETAPLNNEHANLILPAPVKPLRAPPKADPSPVVTKQTLAVTPSSKAESPKNIPLGQISTNPCTSPGVEAPIRSPVCASPSAVQSPVPMTAASSAPISLTAIPSSNQRSKDMHTDNTYPVLEMNIPPAHARTCAVSMLSPLDLSGKSSGPISLVRATYDEAYETLDLSNKSSNSDNGANDTIKCTPIELKKDDVVDLCMKNLASPEHVETLDLSAKIYKNKDVEHDVPAIHAEPVIPQATENLSKTNSVRDTDTSMPKSAYDQSLKIPQSKIRPTASACTTSDEKDETLLESVVKAASDSITHTSPSLHEPSTKDRSKEDISDTPDTTMAVPTMGKITNSKEKELKEVKSSAVNVVSVPECSGTLSSAMSSQLATSLINSLVSLPRAMNTAVTGTTTTTCTTSTSERRSEIVVPIGSVEDLETAKKIAMLPKEILEILGKMPTDHRNQLLDVLPQYMIYNNAVKQLKLVVDISPDSLTSPSSKDKSASNKSEIATQTSSTSTEEVCPPEFLNVDTEKFLIDPFTGAITERANQESELEKPEQEVIDMTKDVNIDKVEEGQVSPPAEEALNLKAVNKETPETVKAFTVPSIVTPIKPKEGSEKTASLRAVRIKTSERRMSQQNLNNLVGKVMQKDNSVLPEKEQRTQLESKTPPAIQQAEVSSTQQNGNKSTAVDSTSPVATKDMNITTQNKERRTSTGIDEHDAARNNLNVDDSTSKECIEASIADVIIMEDINAAEKKLEMKPKTKKGLSKKAAKMAPTNETPKIAVEEKDTPNATDLPADNSAPTVPVTGNMVHSDDSDDDVSLAVILKKKTLNQPQGSKINNKTGKEKNIQIVSQDTIPPKANFENILNKATENKIILAAEDQNDVLTPRTTNKVTSVKKRKSRRTIAKPQNSSDIVKQTEETIAEIIPDIIETPYHDKENTDETSNIDDKYISDKVHSDAFIKKLDSRTNHCKLDHDESEMAKLDSKAGPSGEKVVECEKSIIPDSTEGDELNEVISITQPKINEKTTNTSKKRYSKRKKQELVETTTESGTNSENYIISGDIIHNKDSISLESITSPIQNDSAMALAASPTVAVDHNINYEEEALKTKPVRSKRSNAKDSPNINSFYGTTQNLMSVESKEEILSIGKDIDESVNAEAETFKTKWGKSKRSTKDSPRNFSSGDSTQTPISTEPKVKLFETESTISCDSFNAEEDILIIKSGRSKRSTTRDSPKIISSYDMTHDCKSSESKEKLPEPPSARFEESLDIVEEMFKSKSGHVKKSVAKDIPNVGPLNDLTQTSTPTENETKLTEAPSVKFDESLCVEEDLFKTRSGRSKRSTVRDIPKMVSSDDLSLSLISDDSVKPLRRSRRGKSVYVETPILETPESLQTDIFMENKAPLTKKQLIFSKLLLDEEHNAQLSAKAVASSPTQESVSATNHIVEPIPIKTNRSDYTPDVTIDETTPITEPMIEKHKPSKRKKSPNCSPPEKISSISNSTEEPVATKEDSDYTPDKAFDESLSTTKNVFEKRNKSPNVALPVKKLDNAVNHVEEPVAKPDIFTHATIPTIEHALAKTPPSKCDISLQSQAEVPDNDGSIESPVLTKEVHSNYVSDPCINDTMTIKEPVVAKRKSSKRKKSPNSKQHSKRKRSHEKDEYECILMHTVLEPKETKEISNDNSPLEINRYTPEISIKDKGATVVDKDESLEQISTLERPLDKEKTEDPFVLSEKDQRNEFEYISTKDAKVKSRKSKHSTEKQRNDILLNDTAISSANSTLLHSREHDTKEQEESTKERSLIDVNDTPEILAMEHISDDRDASTKTELPIEVNTKDKIEHENVVEHDVDLEIDECVSEKKKYAKSKKSKLSIEKRKNRTLNIMPTANFKTKNTKKLIKNVDDNKATGIDDLTKDTNVRRNDQTKTTCYDMPRAAARTRAKSLLIKSFMDEIYDPYDIDLEDKLLQDIEPLTKAPSAQNKLEDGVKMIPKVNEKKTKKRMRTKSSSDSFSTVVGTQPDNASSGKDNSSDSDSSKSDVPLKKYAEENAKSHKKALQEPANPEPEPGPPSPKRKPVSKRKIVKNKRKSQTEEVVEDVEESPEKQIEDAEELRSEQFMESFGFFSERKPRKSNLLASKKISETFHIIANEKDDQYFRTKDRGTKRGDRKKSSSASHTYEVAIKTRRVGHGRRGRRRRGRARKKSLPSPLTFCEICRKEFRRHDNYTRHKMMHVHTAPVNPGEEAEAEPVAPEPDYMAIYKEHFDKLKRLTEKFQIKVKRTGPERTDMSDIKEVMADAEIHQYRLQKYRNRRSLSRDEALFLHCCELLKSNKHEIARATFCGAATTEPRPSTSTFVATTSTVTSDTSTSKSNDSDVDSITARTTTESEHMRNFENDLMSGIKEAVEQNLAATAAMSLTDKEGCYEFEPAGEGNPSDVEAHESGGHRRRRTSSADLTDKLSSPKAGESPFSPAEEPDSAEEPARRGRKARRSAAKLSEMLDIDLFEDKFDKIKRKCRSQAAAAKHAPPAAEPVPSTSGTSHKVKKKSEKGKMKKSSKNQNMVMTKGALKGFEGFKISIPTSDIDMSAIVPGLAESPPRKKNKGKGKKRRDPPESSGGKGERELPALSESASPRPPRPAPRPASPSPARRAHDVYEFLDNDDAELFPSALKERYKTLKYGPGAARAEPAFRPDRPDDDSASDDDNDDFVYMSDDYMCSPDETENSVMSCELPAACDPAPLAAAKLNTEHKKSALKRKDAFEKNAVMGKIFKNNALRTDKSKSGKGKEPAKLPKANLDQLFDSLLETEPGGSARCLPRAAAPPPRPQPPRPPPPPPPPASDSDRDEYAHDSPLRVDSSDSPHSLHSPHSPGSPPPLRGRGSSPDYPRWVGSTLQDPRPGTSRDSLPYDVSREPEKRKSSPDRKRRLSRDDEPRWENRSMRPPLSTLDEPQPGSSRDSLPYRPPDELDAPRSPARKRRVSAEYTRRWPPAPAHAMLSPRSTLEDPQPGTSRDSLPYDLSDGEDVGGVARHRARRKCTVGKQNVLAETWSSESEQDGGTARANSTESVLTPVGRKRKGKKGNVSQQSQKQKRHVTFKKQESTPSPVPTPEPKAPGGKESKEGKEAKEGGSRATAAGAYTWSPQGSAEAEAEAPAHAPQHGWIVGNSHKKLVTMLAHAKGRRRDDRRHLDE